MNFHFKSALSAMRRSPFQALAAIFVLMITFFVGTILAVLVYSSSQVIVYFETRPQVIAFLKSEATIEAISAIEHKLSADPRIKEVRYVSKEEAFSIYKKATSDNPLLGELVNPTIFPASLEFSLSDLSHAEDLISEVKKEAIIESVGFTASLEGEKTLGDVVERLRRAAFYLRVVGGTFAVILAGASLMVLVVIISMRMVGRREEIEILKLVGAKASFIRNPIIFESVIYSLIGVFLGWLLTLIIVLYLAPWVISYFGQIPILPKSPLNFFILFASILGAELVLGILMALIGSNMALSRARRRR